MTAARVIAEVSLDDLRSDDVRVLQEAAKLGPLHLRSPSDALLEQQSRAAPKFPEAERLFLADSVRWVTGAEVVDAPLSGVLDQLVGEGSIIAITAEADTAALRAAAGAAGIPLHAVGPDDRAGFPSIEPGPLPAGAETVIVTGCFDWLHSGHIRFFMDAAAFGPLYVVVGSDRNVRLLKGDGHPLQGEDERRYMAGSMKVVYRCLVSTGSGWMDAEPEVDLLKPTFYVVNQDGDKPEKREFCAAHGLRYTVLKRVPHEGLPARSSTDLRGF